MIAADVQEAAAAPPATAAAPGGRPRARRRTRVRRRAAYLDIPHSNIRKVVARRMVENKNGEVPHYYLTMEVGNSAQLGAIRRNSAHSEHLAQFSHTPRRARWGWTS